MLTVRIRSGAFPCSSVVEQSAVNRWVVGSNPTGGVVSNNNDERKIVYGTKMEKDDYCRRG